MADELQTYTSIHDLQIDISPYSEPSIGKNADRTHYYDVKVSKFSRLFSFKVKNFEDIAQTVKEKYELYKKLHN